MPAILEKLYVLDLRVGELARPLQIADNLSLRDDVFLQDLKKLSVWNFDFLGSQSFFVCFWSTLNYNNI